MRLLSLILFSAILATAAKAQSADDIKISDAWSRATVSAKSTGVVYFTVTDLGVPDRLTGANTPIAEKAALHDSTMDNGIMRMRPVTQPVPIDYQHPFKATPNGYHLMLTGLKQQLKAGDTFPLTLVFEHAGSISATVKVQTATVAKPMDSMPGMDMGGMDMSH